MCVSIGSAEEQILDTIGEVTLNKPQKRLLAAMRKTDTNARFSLIPNPVDDPSYKIVCGDIEVTLEAFDVDVLYWYMRKFAQRAAARHFSVVWAVSASINGKWDPQATRVFTSMDSASDYYYSICPANGHFEGEEMPIIGSTNSCTLGEEVITFMGLFANLEPS